MTNIISYLNNRRQAWHDSYHLKTISRRLLDDTGSEAGYLAQIRKNGLNGHQPKARTATIKWGCAI